MAATGVQFRELVAEYKRKYPEISGELDKLMIAAERWADDRYDEGAADQREYNADART